MCEQNENLLGEGVGRKDESTLTYGRRGPYVLPVGL